MSTLAKSGALFQLHREKTSMRLAIDFATLRLWQLRRAIRRQRRVIFFLRLRSLIPHRAPRITRPGK